LAVITLGAELVNYGADGIVRRFAFPNAVMGMVVTPAAIEAGGGQPPSRPFPAVWATQRGSEQRNEEGPGDGLSARCR
jgi:hypothetical protein